MKPKLEKADGTTREKIINKLRKLTPGADEMIETWKLG
jgi:hypothetical protein